MSNMNTLIQNNNNTKYEYIIQNNNTTKYEYICTKQQ